MSARRPRPVAPARPARARLVAALAGLLMLPAALAAPDDGLQPCADEATMQAQWVAALNALRAEGGVCAGLAGLGGASAAPSLRWAPQLAAGAQQLAIDSALNERISHTDSAQRQLADRLRDVGYRFRSAGETLAAGQADFARTLAAWVASPSHCVTLMRSSYTEVGLACVERPQSLHGRYWVANFGRPADTPLAQGPAAATPR